MCSHILCIDRNVRNIPWLAASAIIALIGVRTVHASDACGGQWLPGLSMNGVSDWVHALEKWDKDGDGPQPPVLVIGGSFGHAGTVSAQNLAMWDGQQFSSFDDMPNGLVSVVQSLADGGLIIAGHFTMVGNVPANGIARWNGKTWFGLGAGINGHLLDVCEMPNGDIVAAGEFTEAGGIPATNIARWDGTAWSSMLGGANNWVEALEIFEGNLIAGGHFTAIGGIDVNYIAQWNGQNWSPVGAGTHRVYDLKSLPNGDLAAVGLGVSIWDGNRWQNINANFNMLAGIHAVDVRDDGSLVIGGNFSLPCSPPCLNVAIWDGANWSTSAQGYWMGALSGTVHALAVIGNDVYAGGPFQTAASVFATCVARWNGDTWSPLVTGPPAPRAKCVSVHPNGDLIACGWFTSDDGATFSPIGRWNGVKWSLIPLEMTSNPYFVLCMSDGAIVSAASGGSPTHKIIRWDGEHWTVIASSSNAFGPMAELSNGDLAAVGTFTGQSGANFTGIGRWNGSAWQQLETNYNGSVLVLKLLANDDLLVAGGFTSIGGVQANRIARWNGSKWAPLGAGMNAAVHGVKVLASSEIVAVGDFTQADSAPANYVAAWNGSVWNALGTGLPTTTGLIDQLPNSDLLVQSGLGGQPSQQLYRWDGIEWSLFSTFTGAWVAPSLQDLRVLSNGEVVVVGEFYLVNGKSSPYFARWTETNSPLIAEHPNDAHASVGQQVSLHVTPASGYENLTFQWSKNGNGLVDGVTPSSSIISGATSNSITISNAQQEDAGAYNVVIANACGKAASNPSTVTIALLGDIVPPGGNGVVDVDDLLAIINAWGPCPPGTIDDCPEDLTANGVVNVDDLLIVINAWG
jgi:hypothetical protein